MPADTPTPQLLLTREQAAQSLSLCARTVDSLIARGEIRAIRIGRAVRIPADELRRWISAQTPGGGR